MPRTRIPSADAKWCLWLAKVPADVFETALAEDVPAAARLVHELVAANPIVTIAGLRQVNEYGFRRAFGRLVLGRWLCSHGTAVPPPRLRFDWSHVKSQCGVPAGPAGGGR